MRTNFEKITKQKKYSEEEGYARRNAKRKKTQMRGGYNRAIKRANITDSSVDKHDLSKRYL